MRSRVVRRLQLVGEDVVRLPGRASARAELRGRRLDAVLRPGISEVTGHIQRRCGPVPHRVVSDITMRLSRLRGQPLTPLLASVVCGHRAES